MARNASPPAARAETSGIQDSRQRARSGRTRQRLRRYPHNLGQNRPPMETTLEDLKSALDQTRTEVRKVIIGQEQAIDYALICIFTRHHALVEGVPGVAKTLLTRTLAHTLGGSFGRIQFTPDLMPSDITGTNVYNVQRGDFSLVRGPVF